MDQIESSASRLWLRTATLACFPERFTSSTFFPLPFAFTDAEHPEALLNEDVRMYVTKPMVRTRCAAGLCRAYVAVSSAICSFVGRSDLICGGNGRNEVYGAMIVEERMLLS